MYGKEIPNCKSVKEAEIQVPRGEEVLSMRKEARIYEGF